MRKNGGWMNSLVIASEMMGFLGAGNNPMVGMTVACAVAVAKTLK